MRHYRTLLLFLCAVAAPMAVVAQTAVTALHGTITDPSGAVISKAKLSIVNPDTGFKSEHITGDRGEYAFEQITPGTYTVQADAPGFAPQKQIVELLVNQPRTIDFKLGVASSGAETVEVVDTLSALNTNDATIGTPFDTKQIQSLPFEGNNVLDLLSLQAGVLFLGDKTTQQQDSDSRSGAVDGARSDQSNVTLDGLDDNDQNKGYAFSGVLRSTRDSVEEFRVVTTNANADSGRSSGAQVALVTRGGTNKFHGSAYEYYRPTNTVANDWFNKQAELSSGLPNIPGKLLRNTFGGSFGAPILKDKLFGFVAYEGQHTAESAQQTRGVPTDSLRSGNVIYSSSGGSVTLTPTDIASMDPLCSSLGSCPLGPGVDPAAMSYYAQLPAPNGVQTGDGINLASYTFASPNPINLNTLIAKLDYTPGDRHHLFARGNFQEDHTSGPIQFPGAPPNYSIVDNSKGLAAGDTWTLSPSLVNNFRYGFVRQGYANRGSTTSPYVSFQGIDTLVGTGYTSSIVSVPTHNFADDLTWVKGNHTLQFGANYRLILNNRSADATLFNHAEVTYELLGYGAIAGTGSSLDPDAFGFPTVTSNSSYNIAIAAATGMITSATQYYNNSLTNGQLDPLPPGQWVNRHFLTNEAEYYGQDSWKLRPNLTFTFGLRHTLLQVPYERNGQEVVPTVNMGQWLNNRWKGATAGQVVQPEFGFTAGGRANNKPGFWNMDKADLAPRFAVAWQPSTRMNIRAGFGVYYDHFGQGIVDSFDQSGEFGIATSNQAPVGAADADTAPRFGSETAVPTSIVPPIDSTSLLPGDNLALAWGVDQSLKSPYSYAFNLGYQLQLHKGLMVESTYTGRLGRHLLQMRDIATPTNLTDPVSGTDYFTAERQIDQLNDASTPIANVKPIPYWENMFPWMAGTGMTATQAVYQTYFGNSPGPYAGFRGNESSALFVLDLDTPCTNPSPGGLCTRYFDPQYSSLYTWSSMGTSSYNGLQFALHQQAIHGLQFDAYYTLSKSIDLGSDAERSGPSATSFGGYSSQIINVYNPKGNRGVSDYDVRHAVSVNVMDELPFGRNRLIGSQVNKFTDFFIGGWNLSGLTHWTSGLPFSSIDGLGWNTDWADQSWNVSTAAIASGGHKYDALGQPNAFKNQPQAIADVRPPYASESGQRNAYRGDGYFSIDTGISKTFSITERHTIKFAAEAFNVTNSVRFDPASVSNDPYFGPATYGQYTALLTQGRRLQLSLRYSF
ncbi:TonB-dependent receptor [Terracidiphilus gabretensis]|uniref:TonB-dependent receptor n=1 Tax=Terracidiphilus gabretensis TaxID=1577687 RepID=UPI0009E7DE48|nr:TonB-dependent receptor [Terracidiphilus gabretensis]